MSIGDQYEIKGGNLPVVICKLNKGESVLTEAGGMSWHTSEISVSTKGKGGFGKMLGRAFAGESMFQNTYTAHADNQEIAFASSFPGEILDVDISPSNEIVIQKRAFLASDTTVSSEVFFQKKLGAGLFGGEGFIMLKPYGEGKAFLEVDGSIHQYDLKPGEKIVIDTGHLVAMDSSCSLDIEKAGDLKSMFLGGEGLFNTVITGPGRIYIQSMPLARLQALMNIGVES